YPVDVPPPPLDRDCEQVRDQYVKYVADELRALIVFLEEQTGKKMDYDRLWEIVNRVQEMNEWARKANELRKTVPCPMGAQDGFSTFVPARMMPTSLETLEFYKGLYYELKERVDSGIGVAEQEKYRLLWGGGVPPWHSMYILDYFLSYGAVFVFETTYSRNLIPFEIPPNITDPVEAISLRNFEQRTRFNGRPIKGSDTPVPILPYLDWIKEFKADGMVTHASRSCRASTVGKRFLSQLLQERLPLPFLAIEGDLADLAAFSKDETKNRIDIFMELMAGQKM
ncbi:MAG: 2-hydroxyacyl-CoA dehydratase family protein, partial [Desulfatiglandales bacterium]|nr:2-hydroxyacyl-CoA dehydratase family protein [Desulfatiglandales bacterium]